MVVFCCNACGESVKKNKVQQHYEQKCRNCHVLSCMDCGKDFAGDEYQAHTRLSLIIYFVVSSHSRPLHSCVSEAEKYQGNLFQPKDKANKGDVKQQQWLEVRGVSPPHFYTHTGQC